MTKTIVLLIIAAAIAIGSLATENAFAAQVDYFLKIDGIDGESTDDRHKGEIDIESWSWGETNAGTHAGGGGGGAGKVVMQDFHFVMKTNKATPKLMLACANGEHIKEATLTLKSTDDHGNTREYLKIKFTDIMITSFQTGGSESDQIPTDSISLNFAKMEYEYTPQNPADGSDEPPVKAQLLKRGAR